MEFLQHIKEYLNLFMRVRINHGGKKGGHYYHVFLKMKWSLSDFFHKIGPTKGYFCQIMAPNR